MPGDDSWMGNLNPMETNMTALSKALIASVLALFVAAPALAAPEEQTLAERNIYLFMDGKMVRAKTTDASHAMVMKYFKPLKNGTMIYASGGKLYIGEDQKMANGKMLHTEFFGRDLEGRLH
jgi:hypothetical protein